MWRGSGGCLAGGSCGALPLPSGAWGWEPCPGAAGAGGGSPWPGGGTAWLLTRFVSVAPGELDVPEGKERSAPPAAASRLSGDDVAAGQGTMLTSISRY